MVIKSEGERRTSIYICPRDTNRCIQAPGDKIGNRTAVKNSERRPNIHGFYEQRRLQISRQMYQMQ